MNFTLEIILTSFTCLTFLFIGLIHLFPRLWLKWEKFTQCDPLIHQLIGAFALIMGTINLIILIHLCYP